MIFSMCRNVAFTFCVLSFSCLTKLSRQEDLFNAQQLSTNDFFLGDAEIISSLPWEDYADPTANYVDKNVSDMVLDLQGAFDSSFLPSFSVGDSSFDMLQSSCGGSMTTGKLRARDNSLCQNGDALSTPIQPPQPNVFDALLLPGSVSLLGTEDDAISVDAVLVDDSNKKCKEAPYSINLCCNWAPTGYFSAPKIWEKIELCSLCKVFFLIFPISSFLGCSQFYILFRFPYCSLFLHKGQTWLMKDNTGIGVTECNTLYDACCIDWDVSTTPVWIQPEFVL